MLKRYLIAWLGIFPLSFGLVLIDAVLHLRGAATYVLFYGAVALYVLVTVPWAVEGRFLWQGRRGRSRGDAA